MSSFSGGPKVGEKMKLYRNAGTHDSPTWEEISEIGDVTLDGLSVTMAELKRRANAYTKGLPALFGMFTVGFQLVHGLGADMFTDLREQFFDREPAEFAICNGDIEDDGTEGVSFAGYLSEFPWNQPLEDVSNHDVVVTHGYMEEEDGTEIDPTWLVIEGSS
jgi:hypothetical protein